MTTLRERCTNLVFVNEDREKFSELLDSELTADQLAHCQAAGKLGRQAGERMKAIFGDQNEH